MRLLTYAPILFFTNPPVTLPKISLSSFFFPFIIIIIITIIIIIIIIIILFYFSHFGVYRRLKRICFRFRDIHNSSQTCPRSQAPCFWSDFTLEHCTLNSYVFDFPIPLPPRQEHMKQFDPPRPQWQQRKNVG